MRTVESQQVSWWSVHEFISAAIRQAEVSEWPTVGTPAWCSLPSGDPRKWAALLDAAQHAALRWDSEQEARAEAGRDVAGAVDWSAASREIRRRSDFRATHSWAKRVVS